MDILADKKKKKTHIDTIKTNEKKWSKVLMDAGWTAFPSIILEKQHALGLDAMDINIILYLSTYWWEAENKPHPTKKTIAEALDVTPRTIQRRIAKLEGANFIKREYRQGKNNGNLSNKYNFDGLINSIKPFAKEKLLVIEERKSKDKKRRSSKRPNLKTISGGKT